MTNFLEVVSQNPNFHRLPHPYTKYGVFVDYGGTEIRVVHVGTGAALTPYKRDDDDRQFINLYSDVMSPKTGKSKRKTIQLGEAVLLATQGPAKFPKAQCSHLDGDATNCSPDNLSWETQEANILRQLKANNGNKGASNPNAKLSEEDREAIANALQQGIMGSHLAWVFGVDPSQITRIKKQYGITVKGWRKDFKHR